MQVWKVPELAESNEPVGTEGEKQAVKGIARSGLARKVASLIGSELQAGIGYVRLATSWM